VLVLAETTGAPRVQGKAVKWAGVLVNIYIYIYIYVYSDIPMNTCVCKWYLSIYIYRERDGHCAVLVLAETTGAPPVQGNAVKWAGVLVNIYIYICIPIYYIYLYVQVASIYLYLYIERDGHCAVFVLADDRRASCAGQRGQVGWRAGQDGRVQGRRRDQRGLHYRARRDGGR